MAWGTLPPRLFEPPQGLYPNEQTDTPGPQLPAFSLRQILHSTQQRIRDHNAIADEHALHVVSLPQSYGDKLHCERCNYSAKFNRCVHILRAPCRGAALALDYDRREAKRLKTNADMRSRYHGKKEEQLASQGLLEFAAAAPGGYAHKAPTTRPAIRARRDARRRELIESGEFEPLPKDFRDNRPVDHLIDWEPALLVQIREKWGNDINHQV